MKKFVFSFGFLSVFACAVMMAITTVPNVVRAESVLLQLPSTMVAAIDSSGNRGRAHVTSYMRVRDQDAVQRACALVPRLVDTIITAFEAQPLLLDFINDDLEDRKETMAGLVRDSVGIDVFEALSILPGDIPMGQGTIALSILGETPQCHAVSSVPTLASGSTSGGVDEEPRPQFPGAPPRVPGLSWPVTTIFFIGMGGLLLMIGSYIGYRIGKIRRDRRREERRSARETRRFEPDRRTVGGEPPGGKGERRSGGDRRKGNEDRRSKDANRRKGPRRETG